MPYYIKGTTSKNNETPNILINDRYFADNHSDLSPVQAGLHKGHKYQLDESNVYTVNDQQVNLLHNTDFLIGIQN